jgi:hypothetical protein
VYPCAANVGLKKSSVPQRYKYDSCVTHRLSFVRSTRGGPETRSNHAHQSGLLLADKQYPPGQKGSAPIKVAPGSPTPVPSNLPECLPKPSCCHSNKAVCSIRIGTTQ